MYGSNKFVDWGSRAPSVFVIDYFWIPSEENDSRFQGASLQQHLISDASRKRKEPSGQVAGQPAGSARVWTAGGEISDCPRSEIMTTFWGVTKKTDLRHRPTVPARAPQDLTASTSGSISEQWVRGYRGEIMEQHPQGSILGPSLFVGDNDAAVGHHTRPKKQLRSSCRTSITSSSVAGVQLVACYTS
ncbi:hypothetical protein J6590_006321 [Homalodisca vitripennis]|nr:hypothetical protein J6590_006321 [Homalodisca vitripennis]